MANNNSIAYWSSITNTYSDSLPNPDVVNASIFNDMNSSALELKWRNSVQRTWKNSEVYTAYGSTVPSGYVLMHECVDITFNDMANTSDMRRHIVKFHILKDRDEQIITYRSFYDSVLGHSVIDLDFGSALFPVAVQTANQMGGAPNKLKIEMQATENNNSEFSYWIETNSPITTIFDGKNTARNSSSNASWNNLSNILNSTLGNNKGVFADVYKSLASDYRREYYKLGSTEWKFNVDSYNVATAKLYANIANGSILEIDKVIAGNGNIANITATNLTVSGTTNIANVNNDNIYVSNIYSNPTGGSIHVRDNLLIGDGFLSFGSNSIMGSLTVSGNVIFSANLDVATITADGISTTDLTTKTLTSGIPLVAIDVNSSLDMGSYSITGNNIVSMGKYRTGTQLSYTGNTTPTSLSESRVLLAGGITIDLRSCANTAGDIYYLCGKKTTSGGSNPTALIKAWNYNTTTYDISVPITEGHVVILVGTGTTGVFYVNKAT